jgi:hypothetical protein
MSEPHAVQDVAHRAGSQPPRHTLTRHDYAVQGFGLFELGDGRHGAAAFRAA